jgi:hypothetical protein
MRKESNAGSPLVVKIEDGNLLKVLSLTGG